MRQGRRARKGGHVGLQVQHAGDVRYRAIGLVPLQSARHSEQVLEANFLAAILAEPKSGLRQRQLAVLDEQADDAGHHRLGHGPAEQRRIGFEARSVVLAHDSAVIDNDDCPRAGTCEHRVLQQLIDSFTGLDGCAVRPGTGGKG